MSFSFQYQAPASVPCPSVVRLCEPAPYTDSRSRTANNWRLAKLPLDRLFEEAAVKYDEAMIRKDEEAVSGFC